MSLLNMKVLQILWLLATASLSHGQGFDNCPLGWNFIVDFGCVYAPASLFPIPWEFAADFCRDGESGGVLVVVSFTFNFSVINNQHCFPAD